MPAPLPFDRGDPRQLSWLSDWQDNRTEIRKEIDAWIQAAYGNDKGRIVAVNAKLRAHYHPNQKRSEISEDLLSRMLADLKAKGI